ncbi:hypothetical protein NQ314_020954 [Rhamnusium bicolor]|uniref:DUF5641 domain-containing protein n=1 Tax=Rhamnusium bicolor TaxID=1586634 RepID=A0AAV8WKM9_9CUCU|nr:hypothetical protein NQ314_020954 [Rhamnusium bicolor]
MCNHNCRASDHHFTYLPRARHHRQRGPSSRIKSVQHHTTGFVLNLRQTLKMTSRKIYYTDEDLLKILENDDLSDIEILSNDDDGWEPEDMFRNAVELGGRFVDAWTRERPSAEEIKQNRENFKTKPLHETRVFKQDFHTMAPKRETIAIRNLVISRIRETFDLAQLAYTDKSKLVLFKIKYRLLAESYEEFKAVHVQIISQLPDADLEAQDEIRKEVDDIYMQILATYEEFYPTDSTTPSGGTLTLSTTPSPTPLTPSLNNVRLPKLELIKFSGKLETWQTFIDIFNSSVHDCPHITEINKFQYLIASLSDEPLTLIKSIPLTATNYELAYSTLVKRYSNKRLLTLHHWRTLKNYPALTTDNFKMLRQLIDTFSENIAVLENLGCNVKEWDFVLTDLLLDKLDAATRTRFELSSDATVIPKYDDLKDFLLKQCIALETVSSSKSTGTNSPRYTRSSVNQNPSLGRSNVPKSSFHPNSFVVNTQNGNCVVTNQSSPSHSLPCHLCKMNHFIYRCPSFLAKSPSDRFQAVKQARLCVNCLRQYHPMANCPSQHTCKTCKLKHHSLLHFNQARPSASSDNFNLNTQSHPQQGRSSPPPPSSTGVNACTSFSSEPNSARTTVLLATVSLEIKNKWGNFSTIRALLDPGSQASFIVDSSVKHLGLMRSTNHTSIFSLGQTTANSSGGITTCHIRLHGSQQSPLEERLAPTSWRYVPSIDNPADPASRGLLPNDVLSCSLWWAAPTFLQQTSDLWPLDSFNTTPSPDTDLEEKSVVLLAQTVPSEIINLLNKFSSLRQIQGIVAYIFRFIGNVRSQKRVVGSISADELHQALFRIVKIVQNESFPKEISTIRNNQKCPKYLQKLAPFLDADGILRVGGRLSNSDLTFSVKHPALLSRNDRLTELIIQQMHQRFWTRWKDEYLHNLYQRSKWSKSHLFKPVNIGTLVLIKDNLTPPLKWRVGRIVELYPGNDGVARVASVLTPQGIFKRPLIKLCALPSQ